VDGPTAVLGDHLNGSAEPRVGRYCRHTYMYARSAWCQHRTLMGAEARPVASYTL